MEEPIPEFVKAAALRVKSQPLNILVFGPGASSPGGTKRQTIVDFVRGLELGDEVTTPERAIPQLAELEDLDEHDAERLLLHECDMVIVLLVQEPDVTGPGTEIAQFATNRQLGLKFFVIEPRSITDRVEQGQIFYQLKALLSLSNQQRFSYTPEQFASCTAIRDAVRKWMNRMRYQKLVDSGAL